ncbi:hypothetical protein CBER1_03267 [Cercospora berteroae]|uniref:Phospholipase/carboxylesterase/thioesterase domain-containing protein n=1 Tax=Cercospora berteroae TaxID=357750 RepID=A0A2S6C275_9PEZI|nr:hypothetical protein CBER1_03267 [Cercospora berteroae]
MLIAPGKHANMDVAQAPAQREISLKDVFEVIRDEFALYFNSTDVKRRTCINAMWKRLGLFWRIDSTLDSDKGESRKCLTFEPLVPHTQTIVFLHGRDSTAKEFAKELFESTDSHERTFQEALPGVKWVFPTAPVTHCVRYGLHMSQWFDMQTTQDPHEGEIEQDPTQSIDIIYNQLSIEAAIVGWQNVILAGISQGAAVGIHVLLKQPHKLGGFIGLNTWLPRPKAIEGADSRWPGSVQTPVMLAHTIDDPIVYITYGEELARSLEKLGMNVEWHDYETEEGEPAHWVNEPEGVDHIVKFVRRARKSPRGSPLLTPSFTTTRSY